MAAHTNRAGLRLQAKCFAAATLPVASARQPRLMHGLMRILTVLCLLLVATACGGSQPSATPPEPAPPPTVEPAPAAEPVPEPTPAAEPPAATEADQEAPTDTKLAVQGEASHSIFAVLKVKDPKAFA